MRPAAFKDRKTGLILFGILQLFIALGLLVMAGSQILVFLTGGALLEEQMVSPQLFVVTAVFYLLLCAGSVWLGIGSILCRRWARALTLVLSWMGLVVGLLSTVFLVTMFRFMAAEMRSKAPEEAGALAFAMGCGFLIVALIYFVLPTAFVLFYRSPHVKATCEHYDPKRRWTDRLPLPVLAGGVLLLSAVAMVFAPLMGTPLPFFGALLTGAPAWLYSIVVGALTAVLLRGYFHLERWAWLGTVALMTVNGVSVYLTFRGDGVARMYEAMNVPPSQLEQIEAMGIMSSMPWLMLVSILAMLGFYLWLGKYFGYESTRPQQP